MNEADAREYAARWSHLTPPAPVLVVDCGDGSFWVTADWIYQDWEKKGRLNGARIHARYVRGKEV